MIQKSLKLFFILVAILTFTTILTTQTSLGYELTQSISSGITHLNFRDISNTNPEPNPVLSLDKSRYRSGEVATITLNDSVPNVSLDTIDFAFAKVDGSSLTLTETDENSGIFTGSFAVGNVFPSIEYVRDFSNPTTSTDPSDGDTSSSFARMSATLDVSNPGEVITKDVRFTDDDFINLCFRPVLHAVDIELADGATLGSENTTVTLSYANAVLLDDDQVSNLQMYYKKNEISTWEVITPNTSIDAIVNPSDPFSNDFVAKTITSDPAESGYGAQITTGKFTLGFETGCGGGGGGGLIRPSLVVNALAGIGSFGGGSDFSPPLVSLESIINYPSFDAPIEIEQMVTNQDPGIPLPPLGLGLYDDFDYPLEINDVGFVLGGFSNTIQTQTLKTDETNTIKITLYESTKIQHISLYMNLRDANTAISQSDTQILYYDGQPVNLKDPNGFFSDVSVTVEDIGNNKKQAVFTITFAKEMDTSDIIIRAWDPQLNSRDTFILDAIQVVSEPNEDNFKQPIEEPIILESHYQPIPTWIKNNAGWWSDEQIEDSDFISGIEYLIQNGIITIPEAQSGISTSTEIPDWIKNNAGWWSDSLITDSDFLEAMQWLVANGIIHI